MEKKTQLSEFALAGGFLSANTLAIVREDGSKLKIRNPLGNALARAQNVFSMVWRNHGGPWKKMAIRTRVSGTAMFTLGRVK